MRSILMVVFILFCFVSFSQSIQIVDKKDNTPVPYATVLLINQNKIVGGNYCNQDGFLNIDNSVVFDKAELSCVGYETKVLEKLELNSKIIFLENKVMPLQEIVISNKSAVPVVFGYTSLQKKQLSGIGKGLETVVFIENTTGLPLFVQSFLFKVGEVKKRAALRIHFYKKQLGIFEPGEEILTDDLIEYLSEKTKGLVEINIAKHRVELPEEGFFVGIESLGVFDESTNNFKDSKNIFDNLFVEYNTKLDNSLTFSRNRFKNKSWIDFNEWLRSLGLNSSKNLNLSFGIKASAN